LCDDGAFSVKLNLEVKFIAMDLTNKIRKNLAIYLPSVQTWLLSGFDQGEIETIAGHVADRTGRNPSQPLVAFARALAEKATVIPNRFTENGEKALLDCLSEMPFRVIFDVGANVGTWSTHALNVFPHATLHAFEIVPTTFEALSRRIINMPRVNINPFGLSDHAGRVHVYVYSSNLISSMFALDDEAMSTGRIDCEVRCGADYAVAHDIQHIDILKIDVEGAEGKVLAGFEPMISEGRVRLIQFEYNRGALLGDFLLKHSYAFFTQRGYQLGKLTPNGVQFHTYSFCHEDFVGPNYVACRSGDSELIRLISKF
jgi:FkbM family methyltransferase